MLYKIRSGEDKDNRPYVNTTILGFVGVTLSSTLDFYSYRLFILSSSDPGSSNISVA